MRRIDDLLKDLAFNPKSSVETQKALAKNSLRNLPAKPAPVVGEQLAFPSELLGSARPRRPA